MTARWTASYLGHAPIVNLDQVARSGIHLEGLVEAKGRVEDLGGIGADHLAVLDLLEEVRLLLIGAGGEALLLGGIDGSLDLLAVGDALGLGRLLLQARFPALFSAECPTEFDVVSPPVVEVDRVGWSS
jgi:hypothetical protein